MLGAALDGGGAGGGALVEEKLQPWEASFLFSFLSPYPQILYISDLFVQLNPFCLHTLDLVVELP
jgi:hypothetical protein